MRLDEITGGAPYGATTLAGGDGSRQVTANELAGVRFLGRRAAEVSNALKRGPASEQPARAVLTTESTSLGK